MFFWAEFQFISICSVSRDITLCWYGSQDIFLFSLTSQELLFLTKHWNNSDISSGKCFFTHFRRSLLQVRDSYSIWEIDSIYLWYVFWSFSFFMKSCSPGYIFRVLSLRFSSFKYEYQILFTIDSCIRSFLQEIRFLSLAHIDGSYTILPMDSPYPFFLFHPDSWNIYICYELNDFLLYFFFFSFDEYIIAPCFLFVNTFLRFFQYFYYIICMFLI